MSWSKSHGIVSYTHRKLPTEFRGYVHGVWDLGEKKKKKKERKEKIKDKKKEKETGEKEGMESWKKKTEKGMVRK